MKRFRRLLVRWPAFRGAMPCALAATGVVAVWCSVAHAAEDRAVLKLRGVIHKSVTLALTPDDGADGGHFAGPALRISEEANFAGSYRLYLESDGAAKATFDGRPVTFDGRRGLLETSGLGADGLTMRRSRTLAMGTPRNGGTVGFLVLRTR